MKTLIIAIWMIIPAMVSCQSQDIKLSKTKKNKKDEPKEEVVVNKKYDDNGNLIEFDSTYTSYYSNFKGDTLSVDSIMNNFDTYFNRHLNGLVLNRMGPIDSTIDKNFFHDDFFEKQFMDQDKMMRNMVQEMDSIKNEYFRMHARIQKNENL